MKSESTEYTSMPKGLPISIRRPTLALPRDLRRLFTLLLLSTGILALILDMRRIWSTSDIIERHGGSQLDFKCKNTTLGFEKIVVVSTKPSWRSEGLTAAAERTGIDLDIPRQPEWTDAEVDIFRNGSTKGNDGKVQGPGQARCWLGHLTVLHEIMARKWSTALVMEDDADWDVMVKKQLALVAPMIRQVTNSSENARDSPYGNGWDLLWLGHCGEMTPETGLVLSQFDETLPESPIYTQDNRGRKVYLSSQLRLVHRTHTATCTYAYAITHEGAAKISQKAVGGRTDVISLDLHRWCRDGVLRCVSVNPELFHHHKQAGKPGSEVAALEGWVDYAARAKSDYTANIRHSARCNSRSETLVACQSNTNK